MKNFGRPARGIGRILVLTLAVLGWQLTCTPAHAQLAADEAVFTGWMGETIGVVSATDLAVKWTHNLNELRPVDIPAIWPEAVDVTSDGTRAVIGSWGYDFDENGQFYWVNRIDLVDLTDPQVLSSIDPGVVSIQELDIAPDDSFGIVTGSRDGWVSKFTLNPFEIIGTTEGWGLGGFYGGSPQDVHIDATGTVAAQPMFYGEFLLSVDITGDAPVLSGTIATPARPDDPGISLTHHGISLSEWDNDTILATADDDSWGVIVPYVTVASLSGLYEPFVLDAPGQPESVDITCDGTRAVVETSAGLMWIDMTTSPPSVMNEVFGDARADTFSTSSVAFSPDGAWLFVGGGDRIDVYDATTDPPTWKSSIEQENTNVATLPCQTAPSEIKVAVDIKPGSCPNPINVKSTKKKNKGVLPVAILGTEDFDVRDIDPETILLAGVVEPLRWKLADVATPYDDGTMQGDCFDCTKKGPDGFLDLTLKFKNRDIVTAIGSVSNGDCLLLELTGALLDGTVIYGDDVVRIIKKKKKKHSKKWIKKWLFSLLKEIKKEKKGKTFYIEKKTKSVISKAKPKWHRKYKRH
jgi:WD40 repeat protein